MSKRLNRWPDWPLNRRETLVFLASSLIGIGVVAVFQEIARSRPDIGEDAMDVPQWKTVGRSTMFGSSFVLGAILPGRWRLIGWGMAIPAFFYYLFTGTDFTFLLLVILLFAWYGVSNAFFAWLGSQAVNAANNRRARRESSASQ